MRWGCQYPMGQVIRPVARKLTGNPKHPPNHSVRDTAPVYASYADIPACPHPRSHGKPYCATHCLVAYKVTEFRNASE